MPLVNVRNLTVSIPSRQGTMRAVDRVSFAIERGRTLALVGETGCGKTMTALGILRLVPSRAKLEAESIQIDGRELTDLGEAGMRAVRGADVAMIFQDPSTALNPVFTVGMQVAESLRLHEGLRRREAWERAVAQLGEVGIPEPGECAREYPHQLSGGMRQRAVIAMAIACRPKLLIADEPTTALDVTVQAQIVDLLTRLQAEREMALLLITHDLGVVAETAHEVAVMYAGRIVEQATVRELFGRPRHPYTRDLLAAVPRLTDEPGQTRLASIKGTVPELIDLPPGCAYAPRCSCADAACGAAQALQEVEPGRWVRCCHVEVAAP